MPVSAYFKGKGRTVLARMKRQHGAEDGERMFYATANKHPAMKPPSMQSALADRMAAGAFKKGKKKR